MSNIAIIGGGASGLFASILLASQGIKVSIYEKNNKIGKKLLATGNGRCNITNRNISNINFHSLNKDFVNFVLKNFSFKECKSFFNDLGLEFTYKEDGKAYPLSLQASSVIEILQYEAIKYGVKIYLDYEVKSIKYSQNRYIIDNKNSHSEIIIATGSKAMKKLGASDSGYLLAKSLKHKITPILPSLVQLKSSNKNLDIITGVKIEGDIKLNNKKLQYGDILFTKYGLSGSAILDISRQISFMLVEKKEISLTIDLLPQIDKNILINILSKELKKNPNKDLILWLNGLINKKLAKYIILNSKIPTNIKYIKFLSPTHIKKVVDMIKNLPFIIIDTQGFESCEVCAGGVDTKDINPKTMESKIQKGLYFIGEVLDVDGDCGGYNLHWAWGSGFLATQSILQSVK